ncbi:MAG: hypothetical protein ABIQ32_02950 [Sphingomicrobium sp.]
MSVRSFKSVFMVASCAGAALGCYLVSLRVATERASLEDVETQIVLAQRDLRLLQTEIGTRGRLAQLERWNASVMALSAPKADQFLDGTFQLAQLAAPEHKPAVEAPVVLASAPKPEPRTVIDGDGDIGSPNAQPAQSGPAALMHEASLRQPDKLAAPAARPATAPQKIVAAAESKPPIKAQVKTPPKSDVKRVAASTARPKISAIDPLAPAAVEASPKKLAALGKSSTPTRTKDSAKKQ